jgi:antitoxin (DNA-binding transcriptional repressor) of toxin-antitoxin stability system
MEMSIREAKARFSEAIAAVERGEAVLVTKHGKPVAQIAQPPIKKGIDWAAGERFLKERGLDKVTVELPDYFDDPAYSRKVLGLED